MKDRPNKDPKRNQPQPQKPGQPEKRTGVPGTREKEGFEEYGDKKRPGRGIEQPKSDEDTTEDIE